MMMNYPLNYKHILLFFSIVLIAVSCKKEITYKLDKGILKGEVIFNNRSLDKDGVNVIIEGDEYNETTITNELGEFTFEKIASSTYNLTFSKEGFCTHKILGYNFLATDTISTFLNSFKLYELPVGEINTPELIVKRHYNSIWIDVSCKINSPNNNLKEIRYFISNTPDVSYKNYISTKSNYIFSESFYEKITIDTTIYPTGTNLFLIMYPAINDYPNQKYKDIETGLDIYTSINTLMPSAVMSVKIPKEDTYR